MGAVHQQVQVSSGRSFFFDTDVEEKLACAHRRSLDHRGCTGEAL